MCSGGGTIRKQQLAPAGGHHIEAALAQQPLDSPNRRALDQQIAALGRRPQARQVLVGDEHVAARRARRSRTPDCSRARSAAARAGWCRRRPRKRCSTGRRRSACPGGARISASASGREPRYGSKTTSASRAAWKNSTIMTASASSARRPGKRHAPTRRSGTPRRPAPAAGAGRRTTASVRSPMWPSDSV